MVLNDTPYWTTEVVAMRCSMFVTSHAFRLTGCADHNDGGAIGGDWMNKSLHSLEGLGRVESATAPGIGGRHHGWPVPGGPLALWSRDWAVLRGSENWASITMGRGPGDATSGRF